MVKIAIIGAGFMGQTHAAAYAEIENAELTAICDRSRESREAFAENFGCSAFADFETMLAGAEFDVVDICLPTFLHEEYVGLAARAKKDIFCEKPFTLSVASMDRMLETVRENQVRLFVGQVLHFWQEYVLAKRMIDGGELGEIRYVYAARLSEHPNWGDWYRRPENSGGGLFDLHLHDVDFMIWTFGEVESVYAAGKKNAAGCWNYVSSILNFRNGISATVQGVIEMEKGYPFTMELRLVGSEKTFDYVMRAGDNLRNCDSALRITRIYDDGAATVPSLETRDAYTVELEDFVGCVAENRESGWVRNEDVRKVLCTIEALQLSLESGEKVPVNYGRRNG